MSQRKNAPYRDSILSDGITIEYEGHDIPRTDKTINPKMLDQPLKTKNSTLTQNGLFAKTVDDYKSNLQEPEIVRVYEKLITGVWSEKGLFKLIDYKYEKDNYRKVFLFILEEIEIDIHSNKVEENKLKKRTRIIPSVVKKEAWIRDGGKCVICGAKDELHFDHDLPYSRGGTSITAENVRILCARHNIEKSNKIQ